MRPVGAQRTPKVQNCVKSLYYYAIKVYIFA
jgi:hypothetical protein